MQEYPKGVLHCKLDLTEADVYEAMKEIPGYLDITPSDFHELYGAAIKMAIARIERSILARDVMTAEVFTVGPDTLLKDVANKMASSGVSGLPVVDDNKKPLGVISEKDFLYQMAGTHKGKTRSDSFMLVIAECLTGKSCLAAPIRAKKAADIMSTPAVTVTPKTTVREIAELFVKRNINRVPVVDSKGAVCGIVTRADIVRSAGLVIQT